MSQKQEPFGNSRKLVCMNKLVSKETQRSASCFHVKRSWVGWVIVVIVVLGICSILANVVQLVLYTGLQQEVDRQGRLLEDISTALSHLETHRNLESNKKSDSFEDQKAWDNDPKPNGYNSPGHQKHESNRSRRSVHCQSRCHQKPVTQLQGSGTVDTSRVYLQWKMPSPSTYRNSFTYLTNSGMVDTIIVRFSGIYNIFSQVAFHGRRYNTDVSEYGYEVYQETRGGTMIQLLKGILTQDGIGQSYNRHNIDGDLYPLDTVGLSGVFHLTRGDKLRVKVSDYCRPFARIHMDGNYTHFGAFLINFTP